MPDALGADLDGKVVVVTGAARGIGAGIAERLGTLGARVVLLDIDADPLHVTATALVAAGIDATALVCDVADEPAVDAAVAAVQDAHGRCDGLVNNAGVISWGGIEDLELAEWDRVLRQNLTSCFLCARGFGRLMLAQGSGSIVNVSSVAGSAPEAGAGSYAPSKAGAIMLARQLAVEWGPRGIRANTISPGIIASPMAQGFLADPDSLKRRIEMIASDRIGTVREIADVAAFLLSDASGFVNGQNIEVDGGMMQMMLWLLPHPGVR